MSSKLAEMGLFGCICTLPDLSSVIRFNSGALYNKDANGKSGDITKAVERGTSFFMSY
jgi:hypothetical protein